MFKIDREKLKLMFNYSPNSYHKWYRESNNNHRTFTLNDLYDSDPISYNYKGRLDDLEGIGNIIIEMANEIAEERARIIVDEAMRKLIDNLYTENDFEDDIGLS